MSFGPLACYVRFRRKITVLLSLGQRPGLALGVQEQTVGTLWRKLASLFFPRGMLPRARNSARRTTAPLFLCFQHSKAAVRPPFSMGYKANASRIWHTFPGRPTHLPPTLPARVKVKAALWARYPLLAVTPPASPNRVEKSQD
jgi:hypothetical protein